MSRSPSFRNIQRNVLPPILHLSIKCPFAVQWVSFDLLTFDWLTLLCTTECAFIFRRRTLQMLPASAVVSMEPIISKGHLSTRSILVPHSASHYHSSSSSWFVAIAGAKWSTGNNCNGWWWGENDYGSTCLSTPHPDASTGNQLKRPTQCFGSFFLAAATPASFSCNSRFGWQRQSVIAPNLNCC